MLFPLQENVNTCQTALNIDPLPQIIWVAARPPIPPFTGITAKTLCGLDALSTLTEVDVITFDDKSSIERTVHTLKDFWKDRVCIRHVLPHRDKMPWHIALKKCQFQLSSLFEPSTLAEKLSELGWANPNRLVIFDDILLTPIAYNYGMNSILSPHDCMSQMFLSHYKLQKPSLAKLQKYTQYKIAQNYEQKFYHSVLLVHLVTQRDRILLEGINPVARYHVVPNSDLLNPGLVENFESHWDLLIWGDLTIEACLQGTRAFLTNASNKGRLSASKVILVGKISQAEAENKLGKSLMANIAYSSRLEDESGEMLTAKIILIPDIGGAGIKNRVINVVSSGLCLACLLTQMEGVEALADRGAINAVTMDELVQRTYSALDTHEYKKIAQLGKHSYRNNYSLKTNREHWREMVLRAVSVRRSRNFPFHERNL